MCCVMPIRGPQAVHFTGHILTGPQLRSRESWQASAAAASPVGRLWRPDQALAVFDAPWKHPPAACSPLRAPGCCCLPWQLPQSWKACSGKLSHACACYIHHRKLHVMAATRATPSEGWGMSAASDGIARWLQIPINREHGAPKRSPASWRQCMRVDCLINVHGSSEYRASGKACRSNGGLSRQGAIMPGLRL